MCGSGPVSKSPNSAVVSADIVFLDYSPQL
jgi:hypothetical protein